MKSSIVAFNNSLTVVVRKLMRTVEPIAKMLCILSIFSFPSWAQTFSSAGSGYTTRLIIDKTGNEDVSEKTIDIYAGQHVYLLANASDGSTPTSPSWTVAGTGQPIVSWTANNSTGTLARIIHESRET